MSDADDILRTFTPYDPNPAANYLFGGVYVVLCLVFVAYIVRRREWWALCLPTGCLVQAIGYFNRVKFAKTPTAGLYFAGDLFVTVAPVAYLAFNYIIFARLCYNLSKDERVCVYKSGSLTVIPNGAFKTIFVLSDVATFLAQTAGGMMQIFDSVKQVGRIVLTCGIVAQTLSYVVFTAILLRCMRRWDVPADGALRKACRTICRILAYDSVLILIRSLYRCIELPTRPDGALAKSEAAFFVLDVVPLLGVVGVYAVFWPPRIVPLRRDRGGFGGTTEQKQSSFILPLSERDV